jgi:hypothetical protein
MSRPEVTILAGAEHAAALRQLAHILPAEDDTRRLRASDVAGVKPVPPSAASGNLPVRPAADAAPDRPETLLGSAVDPAA